jgi:murein DD-endopeptidase MepM/ murein hydrolase activator NlpD
VRLSSITSRSLVLVLAFLALPAPTASAKSSADVRRELEQVTARLQAVETEQALVVDRLTRLNRELAATEATLAATRATLGKRVRNIYMSGMGASPIQVLLTSEDPDQGLERMGLLEATTRGETEALRAYRVSRRKQRQVKTQVEGARKKIDDAERRLRRDTAALGKLFDLLARQEAEAARKKAEAAERARQARLAAARAEERRLLRIKNERERAAARERQRRARERASRSGATRVSTGGHTCPVGPAHSFVDTWGAARSGGRRHQGTDIFAPHGSPVYAVVSGRVRTDYNRLGGVVLYLNGDDGHEYYYAHNSANVAGSGQRVAVGELIARVGQTGNARGTSPHVHFELHPGGGSPVNPYGFLRSVCG